jgi:hypothetical protein
VGAVCDRRGDVLAGHDAGVEVHLDVRTHGLHDVGQQVERDRSPVQLAAAVVGQQHRVDAEVGHPAGIGDGLHALDHDLARPLVADPGEIAVGHRRVEHGVQQLRDRP